MCKCIKVPPFFFSFRGDHTEAVEIDYNEEMIKYEDLLKLFWKNIDSTGNYKRQYRTAIFYRDEDEKKLATESKNKVEGTLGTKVITAIEPFQKFYPAEEYVFCYFMHWNIYDFYLSFFNFLTNAHTRLVTIKRIMS